MLTARAPRSDSAAADVAGDVDSSLARRFCEQARSAPAHAAIWSAGKEISYQRLAECAGRLAAWLHASDVGPGDRVAVVSGRSAAGIAGILGTCWSGAAYVPCNVKQPRARLRILLGEAAPSAVIVDAEGRRLLEDLCPEQRPDSGTVMEVAEDLGGEFECCDGLSSPVPMAPHARAYIIFTSGTTGAPKGVELAAGSVRRYVDFMGSRFSVGPEDRMSQFYDFSFDASIFDLFVGLGSGATLFMLRDVDRISSARFIQKHQLTIWKSVPSATALMSRVKQLKPGAFPSLRLSLFGGEALSARLVDEWRSAAPNSQIVNTYGPTEAAVGTVINVLAGKGTRPQGREGTRLEDQRRDNVSIGTPHPEICCALVDEDRRFLEGEGPGELALSGPQLAVGYWNQPELTRERFPTLRHPEYGERRWYLTGDRVVRDADGALHYLGRVDNQVKVMGHRVELEELDWHLREICGTEEAASVAWPVVDGAAQGLVAFVKKDAHDLASTQLQLKEVVPTYMMPSRILEIDRLPLTANGKLDRGGLVAILESERSQEKTDAA